MLCRQKVSDDVGPRYCGWRMEAAQQSEGFCLDDPGFACSKLKVEGRKWNARAVRRVIKVATTNNMPAPEEKNILRKLAGSRE
jgi:hypothetical protein